MLILQIRQAETALKDGRLDEAFELARTEEVRAHRRGQDLVGRLARALVARGREHLAAGRMRQASADGEKAGQLGGNLPEAAALRTAIADAVLAQQRVDRQEADAVAAARAHIENGRLTMGQQLLADVSDEGGRARALRDEAADKRAAGEAALGQAQAALDRDDWASAIDALLEARQTHASRRELTELCRRVEDAVAQRAQAAIDQGRLDRAEAMIHRLTSLASGSIEVRELERIIQQCRAAGTRIDGGELREAVEILRRLGSVRPQATWISDVVGRVQQAAESMEQLRGGPLGLLAAAGGEAPAEHKRLAQTEVIPTAGGVESHAKRIGAPLPKRFMLQVDGVGGFLVLRDRRIAVGPVSSSRRPDVGLLAEAGLPVATIERTDEDYFLTSDTPIRVNDTPVTRKLLTDGDRIALSARCRMKFGLPNAASTSAVIDLSSARLPRGDARRVILLDKSIIVGPGASAHIRAAKLAEPVVLYVRDDRLFPRSKTEVTVDDRPMDRQAGIPLGVNVRTGGLSFVVTAA